MATSPTRPRSLVQRGLTAGTAVLMLTLAACGGEQGTDDLDTAAKTSPSASATSPAPATQSTDEDPAAGQGTTPSESASPETTQEPVAPAPLGRRARVLSQRLLTADQLRPAAPGVPWRGLGVSDDAQERFVTCHPYGLSAIGAEQVRMRRFVATVGQRGGEGTRRARAGHLLALFPDGATTRRAGSVLGSWHDGCERRLSRRLHRVRVGEPVSVEGLAGPASWYRTSFRRRAGSVRVVELTGRVRVGPHLGVVVLRHRADSVAPGTGRTEVEAALERAAAALG